jgi:hypothetical protein
MNRPARSAEQAGNQGTSPWHFKGFSTACPQWDFASIGYLGFSVSKHCSTRQSSFQVLVATQVATQSLGVWAAQFFIMQVQ